MAEVGGAQPRSHGKGKKKKAKRIGVRLDMTPMVDVAFLLLTFFMLTTAFKAPQTMEISIPDDQTEKNEVKIAESNIFQIRVDDDNGVFWNLGNSKPHKVALKDLRQTLLDESSRNIDKGKGATTKDKYKLIVLIKIDKKSKYANMINIVDELDLAILDLNAKYKLEDRSSKLSPRFAFSPMLPKDIEEVKKAQ